MVKSAGNQLKSQLDKHGVRGINDQCSSALKMIHLTGDIQSQDQFIRTMFVGSSTLIFTVVIETNWTNGEGYLLVCYPMAPNNITISDELIRWVRVGKSLTIKSCCVTNVDA